MNTEDLKLEPETLAIHAGQSPDPSTGAIMTPIFQTSTFVQDGPGVHKGYDYSRADNPTRKALEDNLAGLEGARYGLSFSSGCAAMANFIMMYQGKDHFVVCDDVYGGTHRLFTQVLSRGGYEFTFTDLTDLKGVEAAIRPETKVIWIETPTNPLLKLIDIKKVCELAKSKGVKVLVDNTFASPYLQSPLKLGAHYVLHSTTKYLGGHSDVIGGCLVTNEKEAFEALKFNQKSIGSVPSPMDCFLTLRGTKTLPVRMQRHSENAKAIAEFLESHSHVEKVIYPGLKSHPQYELAKEQMRDSGGMISFIVKGGLEKATSLLKKVRIFACAESLGGVESLIEHPAIMTHASVPAEIREELGIGDGLIRISVGLENKQDLIRDLEGALR